MVYPILSEDSFHLQTKACRSIENHQRTPALYCSRSLARSVTEKPCPTPFKQVKLANDEQGARENEKKRKNLVFEELFGVFVVIRRSIVMLTSERSDIGSVDTVIGPINEYKVR